MAGLRALLPDEAAFGAAGEGGAQQHDTGYGHDSSAHAGKLKRAARLCHGRAAMDTDAARAEIEALEDEIERLSLRRERCRKVSLAAKIARRSLVVTGSTGAPGMG